MGEVSQVGDGDGYHQERTVSDDGSFVKLGRDVIGGGFFSSSFWFVCLSGVKRDRGSEVCCLNVLLYIN